jgi:chromosomal replication initiation ATPase DnaA
MGVHQTHPVLKGLADQLRQFAGSLETSFKPTPELETAVAALLATPLRYAEPTYPRIEEVIAAVAAATHVTIEQLRSNKRPQHIAYARQLAMYFCRELTGLSFPVIAEAFNRDHSTVIHGCNRIAARPIDPRVRKAIDENLATVTASREVQEAA